MDATLDTKHTGRLTVVCDSDLEDIIPSYLEGRQSECAAIRELAFEGAYADIKTAAHGMKGSGGCYGFPEISRIGAEIQCAAEREERDGIVRLTDELEEYLGCIDVSYE